MYAFVGTVTGTDTTNGTVTLTVTQSFPSGLAAANSSVTLTVSSHTLILGGTSSTGFGSTLANVSKGDIVAGGLLAPQGDTLTQIEALPLQILLDLPASSSTSTTTTTSATKQTALKQALKALGVKGTSHSRRHHHKKERSTTRASTRRRFETAVNAQTAGMEVTAWTRQRPLRTLTSPSRAGCCGYGPTRSSPSVTRRATSPPSRFCSSATARACSPSAWAYSDPGTTPRMQCRNRLPRSP